MNKFLIVAITCLVACGLKAQKDNLSAQFNETRQSEELRGLVKSVQTFVYGVDLEAENLVPTHEVCDHYKKYNKEGQLIEDSRYVIFEPVSELEMGYCECLKINAKRGHVDSVSSNLTSPHGMWENDEHDFRPRYFVRKDGSLKKKYSIGSYIRDTAIATYSGGLLRSLSYDDDYTSYTYESGKLVKEKKERAFEFDGETNYYWSGNLKDSSIRISAYGYITKEVYSYYQDGKLKSTISYRGDTDDVKRIYKLSSSEYYRKDGRDSLTIWGDSPASKYEYEFHPDGSEKCIRRISEGQIEMEKCFNKHGHLEKDIQYRGDGSVWSSYEKKFSAEGYLISSVSGTDEDITITNYTLDKHGNWIVAETFKGETLIGKTTRTIEYYE